MNYWQRQDRRNDLYLVGAPVEVPGFEGWTFYVRPLSVWNMHYKAAAVRLASADVAVGEYLKRIKEPGYVLTDEDREIDARMNRQLFIEGCLVSWEGVTDRNGADLFFQRTHAWMVLENFPQLFDYLSNYVANEQNFPALTDDQKADIASGNSEPASLSVSARGGKRSKR